MKQILRFLTKYHVAILFCLIIGIFLFTRFYKLTEVPATIHQDEAVGVYDAFSLINTGKDHRGNPWPLSFQAFEDWTSPLHTYISIPFVATFGLNLFATRLPVVLFNLAGMVLLYFVAKKISGNRYVGLFAMFAFVCSMQNLIASRFAIPPNFQLPLLLTMLLSAVSLLMGDQRTKLKLTTLLFSGLLLIVAYPTAKVFVPMILFVFGFLYFFKRKPQSRRMLVIYVIASLLIMAVVYLPVLISPEIYNGRFNGISILPGSLSQIPNFILQFGYRYVQYLAPEFAFGKGDLDSGFRMPEYTSMSSSLAIFFYLGMFILFIVSIGPIGKLKNLKLDIKLNQKVAIFILALTLLAPIPASLTETINISVRNTHFFPFIIIVSSLGLFFLIQYLPKFLKYSLIASIIGVIVIQFFFVSTNYYKFYNNLAPVSSKRNISLLIQTIIKEKKDTSKIYTNIKSIYQPYIIYAFQKNYSPSLLQDELNTTVVHIPNGANFDYSVTGINNLQFDVPEKIKNDKLCIKKVAFEYTYYVCDLF